MNKKNLSVVMAGAMLATSVAPVLADTTTVNGSNKGLLIKEFRELMESKTFANETINNKSETSALLGNYAGTSVYYVKTAYDKTVKTVNAIGTGTAANTVNTLNNSIAELENKLSVKLNRVSVTTDTNGYVKLDTALNNKASQSFVLVDNAYYKVSLVVKATGSAPTSYVYDKDCSATITVTSKAYNTVSDMETAIQNATDGIKFEAYDKGHREENGKYYAFDYKTYNNGTGADSLTSVYKAWENNPKSFPAVYSMELQDKDTLVVTTRIADSETTTKVQTFKSGDKIVDFTKAHTADHKEIPINSNGTINDSSFDHYAEDATKVVDIDEVLVKSIEIDDADNVYNVKLSDLYDGLFLTDKGQELLDTMKSYDSKGWEILDVTSGDKNNDGKQTFTINDSANGLYTLEIEFSKPVPSHDGKTVTNRVVITTNDKTQLNYFANGIRQHETGKGKEGVSRKFPVQVLEGSDRYETAVKVAKENADITTVAKNGNIVLVNGDSLVDGLAAAPLAASVQNVGDDDYSAPILLTKSNSIPQVTKDYIKEVIGEQTVSSLDQVTVYLVGGEGVISKGIENELKDLGLRVVRAGGDNREETSLKVAEVMYRDGLTDVNKDDAFFVGAFGEADAMSIASVAAATKTPIIVESPHGVTDETVDFLKGYKNEVANDRDVTIIGGEKVVSKETENKLADEDLNVERIFGSNRQSTNAKIIDAYYGVSAGHQFNNVVISKDGMNSNKELIDALTATSLAVRDNAPIVLATKSLSSEQINVLEKNADRSGVYVYQVGGNSFVRDIVQTIASRVGLAK